MHPGDICANCGCSLYNAKELGTSSLYFPNGYDIDLCIDCWWAEEALIEESGSNDHPDRLAHYQHMLSEERL